MQATPDALHRIEGRGELAVIGQLRACSQSRVASSRTGNSGERTRRSRKRAMASSARRDLARLQDRSHLGKPQPNQSLAEASNAFSPPSAAARLAADRARRSRIVEFQLPLAALDVAASQLGK